MMCGEYPCDDIQDTLDGGKATEGKPLIICQIVGRKGREFGPMVYENFSCHWDEINGRGKAQDIGGREKKEEKREFKMS